MRIRWRGLELPSSVVKDEAVSTANFGRFSIEPFERGFGHTIGNSLRRILLSSLEGSAVTRIRIKGARHEFTSIDGVLEDVTEIILNVKSLIVSMKPYVDDTRKMRVTRNTPGPVLARDIQTDASVEIRNPDLVLATLTDRVDFEMEFEVRRSRGYLTAVENITEEMEAGTIPVDSEFSPVRRVRYFTEECRVGQKTNYDRLIIEIWTNATVSPDLALVEASKILRKHLNPFVQYGEMGLAGLSIDDGYISGGGADDTTSDFPPEVEAKLSMTLAQLELSVRATNCLENEKIDTVRQLIQMSEDQLLKIRSFGRTSLREVTRKLESLGLRLGTNLQELRDQLLAQSGSVNPGSGSNPS